MKIEYYSACTDEDITVDGKSYADFPYDERKEIAHKILEKAFSSDFGMIDLLDILRGIEPEKEEYDDEPCDQCGHNYENIVWEI